MTQAQPTVRIIPANPITAENRDKYHRLRVAAYCRVSTEMEEQQSSYQVQISYYTDYINKKRNGHLQAFSLMKEYLQHRPKNVQSLIV